MELHALGTRVRVDTSCLSEDQRAHLHELWSWCLVDGAPTPSDPHLRLVHEIDDTPTPPTQVEVQDWLAAPYRISGAVTISTLTQRSGIDMLFHAAGLADEGGNVVVLVAPSGTGKTTAARALGVGLGYVSDESVAIRRDGTVTAYPKPLSITRGDSRLRKVEISPTAAGLARPPRELRFTRLVVLDRDATVEGPPTLEPSDLLETAVRVAAQTSGLARLEAPLDWLARMLTTGGYPVVLRYRDIGDCEPLVRAVLNERAPSAVSWTHHPPAAAPSRAVGGAGATAWVRGPWLDAIEREGRVLLLHEHGVSLLDGLGALAWLAAEDVVSGAALVDRAISAFGPHEDAARLVDDAVAILVAERLLVRSAPETV